MNVHACMCYSEYNLRRSKHAPIRKNPIAGAPILNEEPRRDADFGAQEPPFSQLHTSTSNFWLSSQARPLASEIFIVSW